MKPNMARVAALLARGSEIDGIAHGLFCPRVALVMILAIVTDNYLNPRDTETDTVGDL